MKKIIAKTLFITLLVPSIANASFSDVRGDHSYAGPIQYLQDYGIVDPTTTKFYPDKQITRGELYELVWKAAGFKSDNTPIVDTGFTDVPVDSKYAPYVKKAVDSGILKKGGLFNTSERVNRIDALKYIFDVMGIGITRVFDKKDVTFKDLKNNSDWAPLGKTALEFDIWTDKQRFNPKQKITRGEVAYFILKIASQLGNSTQTIKVTDGITIPVIAQGSTFISNDEFRVLDEVWNRVHDKFVFRDKIDDRKLIQGAISGMVDALGDKYSIFQGPSDAKNFTDSLSGEFEGIGISIDTVDGKIVIVSPIKGTPANEAGLKSNDIIVEVNKKSTEGLTLSDVANLVKGPAGTSVELLIDRAGVKITFNVTRKKIKLDAVTGEMKGNAGYISIRNFTSSSGVDFGNVLKDLLKKNPASIIIDLRDNPGGYLDASLLMLDKILSKKTRLASLVFAKRETAEEYLRDSVGQEGRAELDPVKPEVIFYSLGNGEIFNLPVKVLINGGSASASEIMTASLKENNKALVIGEKSFGKGTVQEIIDFTDGSFFKQTIGHWQTPKENNLTANPITPDITVVDNSKTTVDEVLDYALGH